MLAQEEQIKNTYEKSRSFSKGDYLKKKEDQEQYQLRNRLGLIKHKIIVLSGKGGVGKSTVAANLALTLSMTGKSVGLLDIDIHGPSIPILLNLKTHCVQAQGETLIPVMFNDNLKVISIGFLLAGHQDSPVIWRGPLKTITIRQFLKDVAWGKLDYLIVDSPPGTGDEPLSTMQLLPDMDGVVIVTIPSEVSQIVVKKAVTFAKQLNIPVIGIIENMSGFVCPKCGEEVDIFKAGGGKKIAGDLSVPYLGKIPIDPEICRDSDKGSPFIIEHPNSPASKAFMNIVKKVEEFLKERQELEKTLQTSVKGGVKK